MNVAVKNIIGRDIRVDGHLLIMEGSLVFSDESQEIKNLKRCGYVEVEKLKDENS